VEIVREKGVKKSVDIDGRKKTCYSS